MSCWRVLELSHHPSHEPIPQLLVKLRFGPDAYTIFLTDLNTIWSEELDLSGIVDRALAEHSPIEVSKQDSTQLAILLETVQRSLAANNDTGCRITRSEPDGLVLYTTISLPEPLGLLTWKFHLRKRAPVVLTNELILPLLVSSRIEHERTNSLLRTLLEKDRAITRMLDQFESNNLDLAAAFPSIGAIKSGRRLVKREQAAKYVPGLRPFDRDAWRQETASLHGKSVSTLSLFQEALSECPPDVPLPSASGDEHSMWWTAIGSTLPTPIPDPSTTNAVLRETEPRKPVAADSETDDETEDEFETHENFKVSFLCSRNMLDTDCP